MKDLAIIIIVCLVLFVAYKVGFFNPIFDYFKHSSEMAQKEQVIHEKDGSTTTVKYKNVIDFMMEKTAK